MTSILPHLAMRQWAIRQVDARAPSDLRSFPLTKLECPLVERDSVKAPSRAV
jgi:LacI family transcriptional regulator